MSARSKALAVPPTAEAFLLIPPPHALKPAEAGVFAPASGGPRAAVEVSDIEQMQALVWWFALATAASAAAPGSNIASTRKTGSHVIEALAGDCASWTSTWKAQIADAAPILIGTSSRSSSKNLPGGSRH